jgi:phosphonopyruvate decarboxylase
MIGPDRLYHFLGKNNVSFFTGVPDSLLKHFLKYIQDNATEQEHIITANEGLAVGLAAGYHFRTGRLPLVYLQNSGLGNIVNPLTSLADKEMYAVPMLFMIGWRGRPGTKDEPQHIKMGRITPDLLEVLEIPYYIIEENEKEAFERIGKAIEQATGENRPVALLLQEDIFEKYNGIPEPVSYSLVRENVIGQLIHHLKGDEIVVCTTGKAGREFYEQNKAAGNKISKYLLSVGAMGHASHIALGLQQPGQKIIMLDGDGAILMQMGALATIGHHAGNDFIHIVINNGSHESVGGQPTEGFHTDLCEVAKACGYKSITRIVNEEEWLSWLNASAPLSTGPSGLPGTGPCFVEIRTNKQSRADLGRPPGKPGEWKKDFMNAVEKGDKQ